MDNYKQTANIRYENQQMLIKAQYDANYIDELKTSLKSRKWHPETKSWVIDICEYKIALEITQKYFKCIEENQPPQLVENAETSDNKLELLAKDDVIKAEWLNDGNIEIWVDGACSGNPGPGGYAVLFICKDKPRIKSGGFRLTTNNRMELMAVIVGLESLETKLNVVIYSDSKYVVDAITQGWAEKWKANNWIKSNKELAINPDLWDKLLGLCKKYKVDFKWVKGHSAQIENECCNKIAEEATHKADLPVDDGYINTIPLI